VDRQVDRRRARRPDRRGQSGRRGIDVRGVLPGLVGRSRWGGDPMLNGASLLVLDDDPGVVEFLSESLIDRGFRVEGHSAPAEALDRVGGQPFDLVITDMRMPGMRETDIVEAILSRRPDQLVLLMTAFGSIDIAMDAVRAGACDFIAKPFK